MKRWGRLLRRGRWRLCTRVCMTLGRRTMKAPSARNCVGALRRPANERTEPNKERAISFAAYRALVDVLPAGTELVYKPLMRQLGYDPNDKSSDIETPTGIGNVACAAVLEYRHHDKSNQIGEMDSAAAENAGRNGIKKLNAIGAYDDWTGYRPLNAAGMVPAQFRLFKTSQSRPLATAHLHGFHGQPGATNVRGGPMVLHYAVRYDQGRRFSLCGRPWAV